MQEIAAPTTPRSHSICAEERKMDPKLDEPVYCLQVE
jgi:hypothetical protein